MSRVISFSDLKLCEELAHLNEIQMVHPSNDKLMSSILSKLGIDVEYAVEYLPSKHRNLQGKVVIGFQAVGEFQLNRSFVNSYLCSTVERVAIAAYTDKGLATEMAVMLNTTRDTSVVEEKGVELESQLQPDYKYVSSQIAQLLEIRDQLRGDPMNSAGSAKTFEEVQSWHENQMHYEEKYL